MLVYKDVPRKTIKTKKAKCEQCDPAVCILRQMYIRVYRNFLGGHPRNLKMAIVENEVPTLKKSLSLF